MAAELLWCKISQAGVLRFDGADVQTFLQGQLTNNVASLDAVHSQYTGYCTPKGRLLAVMLLWQHAAAYHVLLPRELCEAVRKRLSMYILRAKVKAADISPQLALYGLSGNGAAAAAAALAGTAPAADHACVHGETVSVFRLPVNRYLVVATLPHADAVEAQLIALAARSPDTLWTALDIAAGIPSVFGATQEQFIPQAVNFDLIDALSYTKGCYPGQEIVARAHYLGRIKQRMVRARLRAAQAPAPGDKLYAQPHGEQASGMVVSALACDAGNHDLLAVVQSGNIDGGAVHWQTPDGPVLEVVSLPYPVS